MIPLTNFHIPAKTLRQLFGKCCWQVCGYLFSRQNRYGILEVWKYLTVLFHCDGLSSACGLFSSMK